MDNRYRKVYWRRLTAPRTDVNDITTYGYTNTGLLNSVTNAEGHVTQFLDHNGRGQPTRVMTHNNIELLLGYHPRGWLETVTEVNQDPLLPNFVTQYSYDEIGQVVSTTSPGNIVLTYEYDDARYLRAIENSLGERLEFNIDAAGNVTEELTKDNTGTIVRQITQMYDELSRLMDIIDADTHTTHFDYDVDNNVTAITDAKSQTTTQDFDALSRLSNQIDPLLNETEFDYDAQGELNFVEDARNNATSYQYDGLGNVHQTTSPDTGTSTYFYDSANNLIEMTDARGIQVQYTYDALNRMTGVMYPSHAEENITYYYDDYVMDAAAPDADEGGSYSVGRLTGMDSQYSRVRYYYDQRGNISKQKDTVLGPLETQEYATRYTYTLDDQIDTITYTTGLLVDYNYDSQGRVNQLTASYQGPEQTSATTYPIVDSIDYMPFGDIAQVDFGNSVQWLQTYDLNYRLDTVQVVSPAGTELHWDYQYDPNGNITDVLDLLDILGTRTFDYDELNRITHDNSQHLANDRDFVYTYDEVSNRTRTQFTREKDGWSGVQNYASPIEFDSNRLQAPLYDAMGNIVFRERYVRPNQTQSIFYDDTFTFNATGRLDSAQIDILSEREFDSYTSETEWRQDLSFGYNPLQLRVFKDSSRSNYSVHDETHFVYHLDGQLLYSNTFTYNNGSALGLPKLHQWIYLNGRPIAQITDKQASSPAIAYRDPLITWYISDHLATTAMGFNENGDEVWQAKRSAFGETVEIWSSAGLNTPENPLRFPGQYYDEELDLSHNWHRYYDANMGRYITSDPIGLDGGINTYSYVLNNPIIYIDPFGLINLDIPGTGKNGTSVHANPGPDVTDFRPEHDPPHVHLGANDGPRVSTETFEPFSDDDARKMTKEQKKFCKNLTAEQKQLIRNRQQNVFRFGRSILQGLSGPTAFSPFAYCQADVGRCIDTIESVRESF